MSLWETFFMGFVSFFTTGRYTEKVKFEIAHSGRLVEKF